MQDQPTLEQLTEDPRIFLRMSEEQRTQWLDQHLVDMTTVQIYNFHLYVIYPIASALGEDVVMRFFERAYPDIDGQIAALEGEQ